MWSKQVLKRIISIILASSMLTSNIFAANENNKNGENKLKTYGEFEIGTVISSDEKMKWIAIDIDANNPNKYLLVTKDIVDAREFNIGLTNYKNSKIRYYLNNEFLNKNFNEEEKRRIVETEIETRINATSYGAKEETISSNDKIFLLSIEEYKKYSISEIKFKANSYVKRLIDENMDEKFWYRDVATDMKRACNHDVKNSKSLEVEEINGIVAAMWYDFSSDLNSKVDNKTLSDRTGGNKVSIEFDKSEIQSAVDFNSKKKCSKKTTSYDCFNLGSYKYGDKTIKLRWTILDYDDTDYIAICNNIIEYLELEYDTYENDVLKDKAYDHSNLKQYLNKELFNRIFGESEKNILSKISGEDYIKVPSLNDVYKYSLLNEDVSKDIDINTRVQKIMGQYYYVAYFLEDDYVKNDITYLLSIVLSDIVNNVSVNTQRETSLGYANLVCSGIRPMIKVDKKKIAEYNNSNDNLGNSIVKKSPEIKFKDKYKFGKYEQDGDLSNGKEDIIWTAIKQMDDYTLLFADKILDVVDFSAEIEVEKYYESYLRSYANYDFYNEAFSDDEKKLLKVVKTSSCTSKNQFVLDDFIKEPKPTSGYDKVFLLEVNQNLENRNLMYQDILKTSVTDYVKDKYRDIDSYLKQDLYKYNNKNVNKPEITHYLQISNDGKYVHELKTRGGFRPMICLNNEDILKLEKQK